jgi:uracil-DNA glycosylase
LVGKNNLLYHKYIRDEEVREDIRTNFKWLDINYNLVSIVDDVVFESLTHFYKIPARRALEFGYDVNDILGIAIEYWEVRHKGIEQLNPIEWKRRNIFGDSWYSKLKDILGHEHMTNLSKRIKEERTIYNIYPDQQDVFKAFRYCTFEHTKVVILGQNPYYTKDTADGLAFSFKRGLQPPNQKALNVIFEEIERDVYGGFQVNKNYNLDYLAKQGVLLLNSALTVQQYKPQSHMDIGWQRFTSYVLQTLWLDKTPKVFMLMGNVAQGVFDDALVKCEKKIGFGGYNYHYIIKTRHPSYDVRLFNSFGKCVPDFPETFSGCEAFSRANIFLEQNNRRQIEWMDL